MGAFFSVKAPVPRAHVIGGSFYPNGRDPVDNRKNQGSGFVVTRAGSGFWEIAFSRATGRMIAAIPTLSLGDYVGRFELGHYWVAERRTLCVYTENLLIDETNDVPPGPRNMISFVCVFRH